MKDLTKHAMINLNKQNASNSKMNMVYFSGMELDDTYNIDSTLYGSIDIYGDTILVVGDYSGYTGLLIIDDEVLNVTSATYTSTGYTEMKVLRGRNFTDINEHYQDAIVRSARLMDKSTDWNISEKCEVSNNNLFAPVISNSTVTLFDDVSKYNQWSSNKIIDIQIGKYVYIFQGIAGKVLRTYFGYISEWFTTTSQNKISLTCQDKLMKYYEKETTTIKIYKRKDIVNVLSGLLEIPISYIKFANGLKIEDFRLVDYITTKDYNTYGELLQAICQSLCIRIKFDCYENLVLMQDLKKANLLTYISNTAPSVTSVSDLTGIEFESNQALIINDINCKYKERKTLYNREDFLDGTGSLRYIKAQYSVNPVSLIVLNSAYEYEELFVTLGTNIRYVKVSDYIILRDVNNGNEFVGYVTTIDVADSSAGFVLGFEKDRVLFEMGRKQWLIDNGYYNTLNTFIMYYSFNELPYVWSLQYGEKTDNLEVPLLPKTTYMETYEVKGKFGTVESNDKKFCGIVEEIDSIYDRVLTNTELKYNQDYSQ